MRTHNLFQGVDAVHARHFQIERDHVGFEFFDLLQAEGSVHRRAHDFNRRIGFEDLRDELAHERGIIHDEHAYLFNVCVHAGIHAWPPAAPRASRARSSWLSRSPQLARPAASGRVRAACSTTERRFRINTTFPSPRIEAPFTRSVEKVWSSKALITSSSSPSKASTARPYFFSPTVMTRMNSLRDFRSASGAGGRPSRNSGSTWLRSCSTS